ncbi:MAG: NADH-quinone oxidoreductase subunit NuoN [Pseudomonadota bacterium]
MYNISLIYPEILVLVMIELIMILERFTSKKDNSLTYVLSLLTLFVAFFMVSSYLGTEQMITFSGHFVVDQMAVVLKLGILAVSALGLVYSRDYIKHRHFMQAEYYALYLFAVLGMMVLVSAQSLLTLYLGLEMVALPSYALVAMRRESIRSSEAGMKYYVMGALASGFILYGISILYGVTGELNINDVAAAVQAQAGNPDNKLILSFSIVFIVAGLAFKLGAVPFHMWIPDVYQGAPTSVTAFIGSVPKIATFGMIMRILVEAYPGLSQEWGQLLVVLCVLSIAVGNISAVVQTNFKRMLAYSAIAHIGYFLMGIIAGTSHGYAASMFYILVYAFMTIGAFGMIIFMSRAGFEGEEIADFKGLARRNPWYGFIVLVIMMSMAGIPPFIGFWPKLEVIRALIESGVSLAIPLAITAVVFSIVGAYYYLMVCKAVFFDEPETDIVLDAPRDMRFAVSLNGVLMLVVGLFPTSILTYCMSVFV